MRWVCSNSINFLPDKSDHSCEKIVISTPGHSYPHHEDPLGIFLSLSRPCALFSSPPRRTSSMRTLKDALNAIVGSDRDMSCRARPTQTNMYIKPSAQSRPSDNKNHVSTRSTGLKGSHRCPPGHKRVFVSIHLEPVRRRRVRRSHQTSSHHFGAHRLFHHRLGKMFAKPVHRLLLDLSESPLLII